VQGWYGGRTAANTYNPWTGNYGQTIQGHNAYAQWGHSAATNGHDWVQTGHVTTRRGTAVGYETSGGNKGVITHRRGGGTTIHTNNNMYAGHDGHIYKRDQNGNWSHYNNGNGGWTQAGTLGGSQRKADKPDLNNLPKRDRESGLANKPLGENNRLGDRADNFPKADQTLGRPEKPLGEAGRQNVTRDLDHFENSRSEGEVRNQNFQNFRNNSNFRNNGGQFGGGGFRGGGFRGRR
jgi:hypothetical protein